MSDRLQVPPSDIGSVDASQGGTGSTRSRSLPFPRLGLSWLGLAPFFVFIGLVFVVPVVFICVDAFRKTTQGTAHRDPVTQQFIRSSHTSFTGENIHESLHGIYLTSLGESVKLSAIVAVLGAVLGLWLAHAVISTGSGMLKQIVSTAAAVTANFGGIPLAFLFIATLDANAGLLTNFLKDHFGVSLQDDLHFKLATL